MKRFTILLAVLLVAASASANSFGFYKGFGGTFGASYVYRGWHGQFAGQKPPQVLISGDFHAFFLFAGIEALAKNTGYDVYGYNETIVSKHLKFGTALQYCLDDSTTPSKFIFCPYVGVISWNIRDSSGNSIGARTNYGDRERFMTVGAKVLFRPRGYPFSFGIDASTRTVGLSVGVTL